MRQQVREWMNSAMPALVILLALLMGVQYVYVVDREKAFTSCQAVYNDAFSVNLIVRSKLSQRSDDNKNTLILSVGSLIALPPAATAAEQLKRAAVFRQLFVTFATEAGAIEAARAQSPLPPFPHC